MIGRDLDRSFPSKTIDSETELSRMSSRTPTECVELAANASADQDDRMDAIHELKLANECDELARLASTDDIDDQFRQQALRSLGTAQCDSMLRKLVEDESLQQSLQEKAKNLLSKMESS